VIYGTRGADVLYGGPGSDFCLFAADEAADDSIYGGGGTDTFEIDPGDRAFSVETGADCVS
jgi:Ca2+-binding RTX toxin-like protein